MCYSFRFNYFLFCLFWTIVKNGHVFNVVHHNPFTFNKSSFKKWFKFSITSSK